MKRTPLKRRTWMRRKRPRRLDRPGSDPAYLDAVREMPCCVRGSECWGPIHAHHAIHRSQGGKDDVAIPLCLHHHAAWHAHTGIFAGLSRMQRFAWSMQKIAETQEARRAAA